MIIDFVTDLPPSKKQKISKSFNIILVIIDKYTKALEYILYRKDLDISGLIKLLIDNICNKFDISEVWFSDK